MKIDRNSNKYNTAHVWMHRKHKKKGICEFCGEKRYTHWSNKSGLYDKLDRTDWQELCVPCHIKYDREHLGMRVGRKVKGSVFYFKARDKWLVSIQGKVIGRYLTQQEAIKAKNRALQKKSN